MRAGELRNRIQLQAEVVSRAADGEERRSWATVARVWAAVEPATGSERWTQGLDQRLVERMARIRIRYRAGITEKMQIVFGMRTFDIQSVAETRSERRELVLTCVEVAPDDG
jgi:SPP1 family predicted phage head-tail adaptor